MPQVRNASEPRVRSSGFIAGLLLVRTRLCGLGNCELSDVLSGREYSSEVASANLQCDLTGVL